MKREFKSPCIIKDTTNTVLIMNDGFGYHLHGDFQGEISDREYYIDSDCKNITREYLQNTYGEVESPEHAEFIIELAELHGIKRAFTSPMKTINAFAFKGGNLYLYGLGLDELTQLPTRKITIPLPPKTDKQESSE